MRQHVWSSEVWPLLKLGQSYTCSECCWRTSTEKNTCGIARFPCGSTAFLYTISCNLFSYIFHLPILTLRSNVTSPWNIIVSDAPIERCSYLVEYSMHASEVPQAAKMVPAGRNFQPAVTYTKIQWTNTPLQSIQPVAMSRLCGRDGASS